MPEEISQIAPFVLLGLGLFVLLLSTRQWPLATRSIIWAVGACLLGGATYLIVANPNHFGLFRAAQDAFEHSQESAALQALNGNWRNVRTALSPMLDVFIVLAAFLAIFALIAFLPGERLEKIIRPLMTALIGAIVGGILALAFTAIGIGDYPARNVYIGVMSADNVVDGDTLALGDVHVRLAGADAVEKDQTCHIGEQSTQCGELAKRDLVRLVSGALVVCKSPSGYQKPLRESFGRPIAQCFARRGRGPEIDLSERIIEDGWAEPFITEPKLQKEYSRAEETARQNLAGVWTGCTVRPRYWRSDETSVNIFKGNAFPAKDRRFGACALEKD